MSLSTRRITYTKCKPEAAENIYPTKGFVLLSEGPEKYILFLRKLGDTVSFFVLDLNLLKSGFSAAYVVRKAWVKVCEF
jgi:hypothetical protein